MGSTAAYRAIMDNIPLSGERSKYSQRVLIFTRDMSVQEGKELGQKILKRYSWWICGLRAEGPLR